MIENWMFFWFDYFLWFDNLLLVADFFKYFDPLALFEEPTHLCCSINMGLSSDSNFCVYPYNHFL